MINHEDYASLMGNSNFWRWFWLNVAPSINAILFFVSLFGAVYDENPTQRKFLIIILFQSVVALIYFQEHKREVHFRENADKYNELQQKRIEAIKERAANGENITYNDLSGL